MTKNIEILGLKIEDQTDGELSPEFLGLFIEALIEAGQLRYEGDKLVPVTGELGEGELMQIEFRVEDDEVVSAETKLVDTKSFDVDDL